jgi:hypothetical protein
MTTGIEAMVTSRIHFGSSKKRSEHPISTQWNCVHIYRTSNVLNCPMVVTVIRKHRLEIWNRWNSKGLGFYAVFEHKLHVDSR